MRTKKDLDLLILTLQYGRYCLPIKWDSAKGRIATKSPRQQKCVILTLVVHFLITICRLYSISLHKSVMDRAEPALIAVSYTISFLVRLDVPVDFSVVQLINFISLGNNSHNGDGKASKINLYIRLLSYMIGLNCTIIGILLGILAIFVPCQPLLLTAPLCRDGVFVKTWIVRMFFGGVESIVFINITLAASYYLIQVLLHGVAFLLIDFIIFVKQYENEISKIVEYKMSDKIIGLIFLLGYFLILLFTVVMFSVAAKVNTLSRNWLSRSKWNTCKKWDRKVHRSLTPLRLEFEVSRAWTFPSPARPSPVQKPVSKAQARPGPEKLSPGPPKPIGLFIKKARPGPGPPG
ncbi:hypothetical protein Fcan01_17438 [Folsomia candida]|uniref:Uncharacterized protein n=1 Tax=Folsomia candida TaxID=158441 RepID=A0A226DUG5_FOLCA|nr:hypothetical protein Fcan01_17438 [Folsomia candida]